MSFLLIPLPNALAVVQDRLDAAPEGVPLGPEELREPIGVTRRRVRASEVLLRYTEVVGGKPNAN
jgi:hypothetical protein